MATDFAPMGEHQLSLTLVAPVVVLPLMPEHAAKLVLALVKSWPVDVKLVEAHALLAEADRIDVC